MKYKVSLWPSNEVVEISKDKSLLEGLKEHGIYIKSSCGGCASCSDCIIKVRSGEEGLTTPKFEETRLLGNVYHITKERLSCQAQVIGDVTIDISSHDEKRDQEKIKDKTSKLYSGKTIKRSKEEVESIEAERLAKREERDQKKGPHYKPWEKKEDGEQADERPRKQGGWKRPKQFNTDSNEED